MPSAVETAKEVRKALKAAFTGVKFSVRSESYSMGQSIHIKWTDGPTEAEVDAIASQYESIRRDEHTGEVLGGGNLYISTSRDHSPALFRQAVAAVAARQRIPEPKISECSSGRLYIADRDDSRTGEDGDGDYFSWLVSRELRKTSAIAIAAPPPVTPAKAAPTSDRTVAQSGDPVDPIFPAQPTPTPIASHSKLAANKVALRLVRQLQAEERSPTNEERAALLQYSGTGTIAGQIDQEYLDLRLDPQAPLESDNAFHTPAALLATGWQILAQFGFTHGRILSPSAGIGNQIESQPPDARSRSEWALIEINPDAATIARALHPDAIRIYGGTVGQAIGFEHVRLPRESFDLVYDNFPFAAARPFNPEYAELGLNLHNYFWIKSLDLIRPGGIVAAFTSTSTLDNPQVCRLLWKRGAQLLGAVRLPCNTFDGTKVTVDFCVFQKVAAPAPDYLEVRSSGFKHTDGRDLLINRYFLDHPDRVLGRLTVSGMYGGTLSVEPDGRSIDRAMREAFAGSPRCYTPLTQPRSLRKSLCEEFLIGIAPYSFVERSGKIYQHHPDGLKLVTEHADRIGAAIELKRVLDRLVDLEVDDAPLEEIEAARADLNAQYDCFVGRYGHLLNTRKRPSTPRLLEDDSELHTMLYALEAAIEHEDESGGRTVEYCKQDIFRRRVSGKIQAIDRKIETPIDALYSALNQTGRVDLDLIASLLESDPAQAIDALNAGEVQIFWCPDASEWRTRSHYLSGNTRAKLARVQAIAQADPAQYAAHRLSANLEALSAKDSEGRHLHLAPYLLPPATAEQRAAIASRLKEQDIDAELSAKRFFAGGLGTPWIDPEDVARFAAELIGVKPRQIVCDHAPKLALWAIGGDWQAEQRSRASEYATPYRSALTLIESALNQQKIQVDIYIKVDGQQVKDKEASSIATNAAIAQSDRIKKRFKKWLWEDSDRCWKYTHLYNERFPPAQKRDYSAPWLALPGLNSAITPRPHQRAAIHRGLQDRSALLIHEVGTGKTLVQICLSYEAKRIGLVRKPMLVVLKATLSQIVATYRSFYPKARLLVADGEDKNRLYTRIQTGDYDCIILTHDQFYALPVSAATKRAYIEQQLEVIQSYQDEGAKGDRLLGRELKRQADALETAIAEIDTLDAIEQASSDPEKFKRVVGDLLSKGAIEVDKGGRVQVCRSAKERKLEDKRRDRLSASVDRALHHYTRNTVRGVEWERLGVDFIAFDEVHHLKNLKSPSKIVGVSGISMPDTQRTLNSLLKFRYVADRGGVIVGATGTMPTNTIAELYVMQRFFAPQELDRAGVEHFDAWIGQFAEPTTGLEFTSTGGIKTKTRISRFRNMPQLMGMLRQFADLVSADRAKIDRPTPIKITLSAPPSLDQLAVMGQIGDYMRMWQSGRNKGAKYQNAAGAIVEHNPLTLTNYGSQNAIDPRLVEPTAGNYPESKINQLIHNAWWVWQASAPILGAQLIFCDVGTSDGEKDRFNVYRYIRDALIALGVPSNEIAFIHDYSDRRRGQLFQDVNSGKIRFLLASTEKGGTGVNVQERAIAIHHLDLSWTPAKQEQRNGRGHRQGNLNPNVYLFYYGTTGQGDQPGFDAYKAKLVSDKSAFIHQVMADEVEDCIVEDIGDAAAMYLMTAAILSGNGRALEHAKVSDRLRRIEADLSQQSETLSKSVYQLDRLPGCLSHARREVEAAQRDRQTAEAIGSLNGDDFRIEIRDITYTSFTEAVSALLGEVGRYEQAIAGSQIEIGRVGGFAIALHKTYRGAEAVLKGGISYPCGSATIAAIKNMVATIAKGLPLDACVASLQQLERDEIDLPRRIAYLKEEIDRITAELEPLRLNERELRQALQSAALDDAESGQKARKLPSSGELVPAPTPALYSGVEPEVIAHLRAKGEPIARDAEGCELRWIEAIAQQSQRLAAGGDAAEPIGQEDVARTEQPDVTASAPTSVESARVEQGEEAIAANPRESAQPAPEVQHTTKTPKPRSKRTGSRKKTEQSNVIKVDFQYRDRQMQERPIEPTPAPVERSASSSGSPAKAIAAIARTTRKQLTDLGCDSVAIDRVVAATIEAAKRELGLIVEIDGYRYEAIISGKGTAGAIGALQGSLF